MPIDRSATLVVRVWLEGDADAFRARLTAVLPGEGQQVPENVAVAASPDDVVAAVRTWLDAFVRNADEDGGAG